MAAKDRSAARARQRERAAAGIEAKRCGKPTRSGKPCSAFAVDGSDWCAKHGGDATTRQEVPLSVYLPRTNPTARMVSAEGERRLAELESDPNLLSARRVAALSTFAVEQLVIEPTPAHVLEVARMMVGPDYPLAASDLITARNEIVRRAHAVLTSHAKIVESAAKQQKIADVFVEGVLPIMARLADRIGRLAGAYLPPDLRQKFMADLQSQLTMTVGEIGRLGEDDD